MQGHDSTITCSSRGLTYKVERAVSNIKRLTTVWSQEAFELDSSEDEAPDAKGKGRGRPTEPSEPPPSSRIVASLCIEARSCSRFSLQNVVYSC